MPDYDLSSDIAVNVTVYGKILDDKHTRLLYDHPELDLRLSHLWIRFRKERERTFAEAVFLRKLHLVEGRKQSVRRYVPRDFR